MKPEDMSNAQLADVVRGVVPDRGHAHDLRKHYAECLDEAARRLREQPDYKAEAMAARKLITNLGHGQFWTPDRDKSQYEDARTANESKERANG